MHKRTLVSFVTLITVTAIAGQAQAAVLNFDDLPIADPLFEEPVSSYGGLTWGNTYAIDGAGYGAGTGYQNSAVSGNNVILNGYGDVATTANGTQFTFNGAYLTSAFRDNLNVTINGYLGGTLVSSISATIGTNGPTWLAANFEGIDSLSFVTSGGTVVVDSPDFEEGTQFALDNFTFNEAIAASVPELNTHGLPPAAGLLGCALAGILGRRRRQVGAVS
jgi:hypothetical protein